MIGGYLFMKKESEELSDQIVEYAKANGVGKAADFFSVKKSHVSYLLRREKSSGTDGRFVRIDVSENIRFRIGGKEIEMDVSDFRKAFGL